MVKENGYFLVHRSIWSNPAITKDEDYFLVWIYILSQVEYEDGKKVDFGGRTITLKAGQMTVGIRSQMLSDLKHVKDDLTENKLYRIIKRFESERQIERRRDSKCSLITVLNWDKYQKSERQNAKQMKNRCKTHEKHLAPKEVIETNINKESNIYEPTAEDDDEGWMSGDELLKLYGGKKDE